ncbi:unnamed protein product [Clonostachys byssicola]|uniref:Uncharacterized protein n=1 Tax=Clonostachys byssicola TaxID=160290 RepID=A0A9N9UX42_9HYPO|nr:unnamed protein product [Clonostachys byssicola]
MAETNSAELEEISGCSDQQTVATLAEICLSTFQEGLNLSNSHHPRYLALIEDQLARFSIWTSGNGVFAKARASMDHRLREAPDVRLAICSLLEALEDSLQASRNLHENSIALDGENDDFKLDVQAVAKEISLLYRLTNTIRRASKERQNVKAAESYRIRDDEGNDIEPLLKELYSHYILGKFPSIENKLRSRLATSMVLRRKMVLYRRARYGTNPIRADKNVSQPKINFPQARTQAPNADEPSEELTEGIEAVGTTAPKSSIQSQTLSATTLVVEDYKKTTTPSVISATKTVALANHEELVFPPIPNGRVKQRYKKLKHLRWQGFKERMIPELRRQELRLGIDETFTSTSRAVQRTVILNNLRSCLDSALEGSPSPRWQKWVLKLTKIFLETNETHIDEPEWLMSDLPELLSREIETIYNVLYSDWIGCNEAIGELTCPYCLYAIPSLSVADDKKWKAHVTNDLDAYVCLFDECHNADKLFSHSSDWLRHMREHTLRWNCNSKAHHPMSFLTEDQYLDHVRQDHPRSLTEPQLRALSQRNARPIVPMFDLCPICGTDEVTENLEDHIVGHLRSLALRSLPPHEEDGSGSSGGESGSASTSAPASRSTIRKDPERHISVVFEACGDISSWSLTDTEKITPNVYEPWGGYKAYIESRYSSSLKMGADPTEKFPHLAVMYREEDEDRFLWHNDPSRYFVEDKIFEQIPIKFRRVFEWGFITRQTDEPTEALQHDHIIRSFVNHSPQTQSTQSDREKAYPLESKAAQNIKEFERMFGYNTAQKTISEVGKGEDNGENSQRTKLTSSGNGQGDMRTLGPDSLEESRVSSPHDPRQEQHPNPLSQVSPEETATESTSQDPTSILKSIRTTKTVRFVDSVSIIEGPRASPQFELTTIAERVARALKGSGAVDTRALIQDLAFLTHEQIMSLRTEYKILVKTGFLRKGVNVAKHIRARLKDESPNLMEACYAVALGKWESEAYWCNFWYHSDKVRHELLIESLMGRTNEEIRCIKLGFLDKKYDNSLQKCLNSELEENKFKKSVFLALEERQMEEFDSSGQALPVDKERAAKDVEDLRRAVKSETGGESKLIEILVQGSATYLRELLDLYQNQYNSNLAREILQKCQNLVGEILVHILTGVINRPGRDAMLLHSAITKQRMDDLHSQLLTSRLVRYHWNREHMGAVSAAYGSRYGTSLEEAVREVTRGVWGDFCVKLCTAHLEGG